MNNDRRIQISEYEDRVDLLDGDNEIPIQLGFAIGQDFWDAYPLSPTRTKVWLRSLPTLSCWKVEHTLEPFGVFWELSYLQRRR